MTEQLTLPLPDNGEGILTEDSLPAIKERIDWADAVLIGPGMGRDEQTLKIIEKSVKYALSANKIMVIDADALFVLSKKQELLKLLNDKVILTPHHGEFLRLSGGDKKALRQMPWQSAREFSEKYNCILNLKGAPSLTAAGGEVFINSSGNQGLAKGGSGDILSGLTVGFLSRGMEPVKAAYAANFYHGKAADTALTEFNSYSYQPTDIIDYIKRLI